MSARISIGIACPVPGERAAFLEWLDAAGYEPVPMLDLDSLARELDTRPIEALIADVGLVKPQEFQSVIKALTANRPLILVGNPSAAPPHIRRDATWLDRPVSYDDFKMAVALALAEGRPARRSRRREVSNLISTMDGIPATILDVSYEGVRLHVHGALPAVLPPYFTMRVPNFGVATVVKRVWVAQPDRKTLLCGGIIDRPLQNSKSTWKHLVDTAPVDTQIISEPRSFS